MNCHDDSAIQWKMEITGEFTVVLPDLTGTRISYDLHYFSPLNSFGSSYDLSPQMGEGNIGGEWYLTSVMTLLMTFRVGKRWSLNRCQEVAFVASMICISL